MKITESTNDPNYKPVYEIFGRIHFLPPEEIVHIYTKEHISDEQMDKLRKHLKQWAKECGLGELKERE